VIQDVLGQPEALPILDRAAKLGINPGPILTALRSVWVAEEMTISGVKRFLGEYPAIQELEDEADAEELEDHLGFIQLPLEEVWLLFDGSSQKQLSCDYCAEAIKVLAKNLGVHPPIVRQFALCIAEEPVQSEASSLSSRFVTEGHFHGDGGCHRPISVHLLSDCRRAQMGAMRDLADQALEGRQAIIVIGPGTCQMNTGLYAAADEAENRVLEATLFGRPAWPCLTMQVLEPEMNSRSIVFLRRVFPQVTEAVRPTSSYDDEEAMETGYRKLTSLLKDVKSIKDDLDRQRMEGFDSDIPKSLADWQEDTRTMAPRVRLGRFRRLDRIIQTHLLREALSQGRTNQGAADLLGLSGEGIVRSLKGELGIN
jgi:hypothetical protein